MHEPHLLQQPAYNELLERLNKLSTSSQALWGKMDVAQMLAHLTANLEMGMSDQKTSQTLMGRLFGGMAKRDILSKGVPKSLPTMQRLIVADTRQFDVESQRLRLHLERFLSGGEAGITRQPHAFFGRLTPNEWARMQYLHVDHHFRQFGA